MFLCTFLRRLCVHLRAFLCAFGGCFRGHFMAVLCAFYSILSLDEYPNIT